MAEYVDWIAFFSVDWNKFKPEQSPEQMQANLKLIKAVSKSKRK
jgi:hypothetical protein